MVRTKYKIKLVHLLLTDDSDPKRQDNSISQLEKLAERGIEYIKVWNKRWNTPPPRENFARPEMFDRVPINSAHYGCFRAFADGAKDNFTDDIDAIILCEGDVKLLQDPDSVIKKIDKAYEATQKYGIDYFSLGSKYTLEGNVLQSVPSEIHGDVEIVNKIIGIQMIMFPQRIREYLLNVYENSPWDGADIFLNQNFMGKKRIGIFSESPTGQWDGISVIENRKREFDGNKKKRILFIAPHLSTGGMPQFLLKRVESLIKEKDLELHVIEFNNYSNDFVVQKNKLKELLGERLHLQQLGVSLEERERTLLELIDSIKPDIIHIEECPESFDSGNRMSDNTLSKIYSADRPYQIVETCHNIWMDNNRKKWHPNSYMYCTPYHPLHNFNGTLSAGSVVEYPIEDITNTLDIKQRIQSELGMPTDKINVLNVGLWTQGKNQGEGVEIARIAEERYPGKFQFHFVGNQAGNFRNYWEPIMKDVPSNVTVWGERSDTDQFYQAADAFMFNSTWECNPLSLREAIAHRLPTFTRNLPQYLDMFTPYVIPFSDNLEENADILIRELIESGKKLGDFIPPTNDVERFRTEMLAHYSETHSVPEVTVEIKARVTYDRYLRLHIDQLPPSPHRARFIDTAENRIVHETDIKPGFWYQPNQHWFTPWTVEILRGEDVVWSETIKTHGGDVAVQFDSSSLGDTLAWMGQILRFKEHWGWERVWVRTLKNWLWDSEYYAKRGVHIVDQLPVGHMPKIWVGVFFNEEEPWRVAEHRMDWRKVHLAQIASDRLGIPPQNFRIEKPQLAPQFQKAPIVERQSPIVTFATHSTAQAKYWNREGGWRELIDGMSEYHWVHCSKEGNFNGCEQAPEPLEGVASLIRSSEFFVGISSGLSWFAWALGARVYVISGVTPEVCENGDGIVTIQNPTSCNSCWAWDVFNRGDWNWCPAWKDTHRHFECSKAISPQMVIDKIKGVK